MIESKCIFFTLIDECISRKKALVKSLPGLDEGNMSDELIEAQSDIIRRLADRESNCVVKNRGMWDNTVARQEIVSLAKQIVSELDTVL